MDIRIVEEDDVALFQGRQEMLLQLGLEGFGVHGAIIGFGLDDIA